MKSRYLIILISVFALSLCSTQTYAQRGKSKRKSSSSVDKAFDRDGNIMDKLWFGGMVSPGFTGANSLNEFALGVSPMVGYKITDKLSVGPRISMTYRHLRGNGFNGFEFTGPQRGNTVSTSYALFGRYKLLPAIFAHVEYERSITNYNPVYQLFNNATFRNDYFLAVNPISNEVIVERDNRESAYVGLGYTTVGGVMNTEFSVLYNVLDNAQSLSIPIIFRFGLNYNF